MANTTTTNNNNSNNTHSGKHSGKKVIPTMPQRIPMPNVKPPKKK